MEQSAPAATQSLSPGSPAVPTQTPDGASMSARQKFETLMKNPEWGAAALRPGTVARQQFEDLQRDMTAEAAAVEANPILAMEPAKDGSAYRLPIDVTGGTESTEFDKLARSWLHAAGAPAEMGNNLATQIDRAGRDFQGMDESARAMHAQRGRQALEKIYGADTDKQIAKVDAFLDEIEPKAPGLAEFLDANDYLLADPTIFYYVAQLADAHAARGKR